MHPVQYVGQDRVFYLANVSMSSLIIIINLNLSYQRVNV
jgi:hypothetical protein